MKHLIFICLLLLGNLAGAQNKDNLSGNGQINGHLLDKKLAEQIPFASVTLYRNDTLLSSKVTSMDGSFSFKGLKAGNYRLEAVYVGYARYKGQKLVLKNNEKRQLKIEMESEGLDLQEVMINTVDPSTKRGARVKRTEFKSKLETKSFGMKYREEESTEQYSKIADNEFMKAVNTPLSTLSIDVDRASYSNIRQYLNSGSLPPQDAVRVEEMINYFSYDYPNPAKDVPFSVSTEYAECPWNKNHNLVHIGIKGREIETTNLPASNLVFLIDVSGSMMDENKLPLLKSALYLLVEQLREQDKVSIVVYAGAAGVVLPCTHGNRKEKINAAIEELTAGGSTAGGEGIELAYKTALANFISKGNNRVILATDGDFNVGVSSDTELVKLIEQKRDAGVYLTVLGFGTGNFKDSKMEQLADKGNGNYAYIDNILEAKKVLVKEIGGTLLTIAKDVKIQVEFNPAKVKYYRLVGYENRLLAKEDFNDDKKDAGELGAGHTVTALYEIIPAGSAEEPASVDPLKYQQATNALVRGSNDVLTLKLRYKEPGEDKSKLITRVINDDRKTINALSSNCLFASAVAEFGMLLRNSKYKANASYPELIRYAKLSKGKDDEGYRAEFIKLAETAELLGKQRN